MIYLDRKKFRSQLHWYQAIQNLGSSNRTYYRLYLQLLNLDTSTLRNFSINFWSLQPYKWNVRAHFHQDLLKEDQFLASSMKLVYDGMTIFLLSIYLQKNPIFEDFGHIFFHLSILLKKTVVLAFINLNCS